MATKAPNFSKWKKYTANPWSFSKCSVDSFKRTLVNKWCVATRYVHTDEMYNEWSRILMKHPGERYNPNEQCQIINGKGSLYCGTSLTNICLFMRCTDPETNECEERHLSAATGTTCGYQMWCQKGLCVGRVGAYSLIKHAIKATHF
ncbi:hypothetical protein CHS0354_019066 [Potamilus streckersoni]|nr:hypothetical protein CHS0354_019066 [Potamilus streckersoni]